MSVITVYDVTMLVSNIDDETHLDPCRSSILYNNDEPWNTMPERCPADKPHILAC